jgi:hypothetical protein
MVLPLGSGIVYGEGVAVMTDDKLWIIVALLIIAISLCWRVVPPDNLSVLNNLISGLLGMAVGKALPK